MFLVQQSNRRCQPQLPVCQWHAATHAVESVSIADQDTQHPLGSRGWNLYWNLSHDPFPAIGTKHGLYHDLVAGASFGGVRAGSFQAHRASFAHQVELQLHALNFGSVVGIVVDASETIANCACGHGCCRHAAIRRGEHILQSDLRISLHAECAIHTVRNVVAIVVRPMQCIENGCGHGHRTQARVVQYLVVKFLGHRAGTNCNRHRNHLGVFAHLAEDSVMPVLHE